MQMVNIGIVNISTHFVNLTEMIIGQTDVLLMFFPTSTD